MLSMYIRSFVLMYRKYPPEFGPSTANESVSAPSRILRATSDTLLDGLDENAFGMLSRSAVAAVMGVSTAANLTPSVLLPPTTWLALPVPASYVVKSLNGMGRRTENEPLVDFARCQPDPSPTLTPTRCI